MFRTVLQFTTKSALSCGEFQLMAISVRFTLNSISSGTDGSERNKSIRKKINK